MIPRLSSVTINANSTTVTVNSPSLDFTGAVQYGWQLMIDGHSLPITIVSGGPGTLEIDPDDAPSTALTARAAKVIETKGLLQQAATGLENARQELVTLKNSASQTADANTLAKRDSNGRLKAQPASASDDVVVKSQTGSAAALNAMLAYDDVSAGNLARLFSPGGIFGLGATTYATYPKASIDTGDCPVGMYRTVGGGSETGGTFPDGFSKYGYISVETYDADDKKQTYCDINGNYAHRVIANNVPGDWIIHYTSLNSSNALTNGVGANGVFNVNQVSDLNSLFNSGFAAFNSSASGIPIANSFGTLINLPYYSTSTSAAQIVVTTSPNNRMFFRGGDPSSVNFSEVFHAQNLNTRIFSSGANGRALIHGFATTATAARFFIEINEFSVPSGIQVNSGTFRIRTPQGTDIVTGISGGFSVNPLSSPRMLILDLTTSGLAGGNADIILCADGTTIAELEYTM